MKLGSKYYRTDLEDEEKASEDFERFVRETNALNYIAAPDINYLVTEDSGTTEIYEIRETCGSSSAAKALVLEDTVVEGQLEDGRIEEVKEWYERLG